MSNAISLLVTTVGLLALVIGVYLERRGVLGRVIGRTRVTAGRALRNTGDLIDRPHAPRGTGLSFTFERGEGIRLRRDGRGCPLWYLSDDDYDRAFSEADSA